MSIGEANIELSDKGYVLVSGINNNPDDLARSNGSGKSSILEAVVWCLTGETMRGSKAVVNRYTTEGTVVTLDFDIDGVHYQLVRSKDHVVHKTNLKISVNGEDKSGKGIRDTEKLLKEYLPDLTASLVGSVIILGQGLPSRFTSNSPSGRKEVLEKLCRTDFMIQDLKDRVTARKVELSELIRQHEDAVLTATTSQKIISESRAREEELLSELKLIAIDEFDSIIQDLIKNRDTLEADILQTKNSITTTEAAVSGLRSSLVDLSDSRDSAKNSINAKYDPQIKELQRLGAEYWGARVSLESHLRQLESVQDICPTCGQRLQGVEKPDTSEVKSQIAQQTMLYNQVQSQREAIEKQLTSEIEQVDTKYKADSNVYKIKLSEYEKELIVLNEHLKQLQSSVSGLLTDIQVTQTKRDTHAESIHKLEMSIAEYDSKLAEIDNTLLYEYKVKDDLEVRLGIVNKFNTAISRDFRGHLLSNVIEYINTRAKEYSKDIFETENIQFELDGNNISICYCGKEYEALSGGEKQKVDLIIQFSIRDMLCSYTGFSTNIIALDEIFDNLDDVGCSRVIDLISKKVSDVGSIFIITHHGAELSIPCDSEIVVVKDSSGVSRVQ